MFTVSEWVYYFIVSVDIRRDIIEVLKWSWSITGGELYLAPIGDHPQVLSSERKKIIPY